MTRARPSATVARRRVMRLLPGAALWFGALLAILALANVMGASGWHGALAGHDNSQVTAAVAHHDDGETSPPEIDLHKITHGMMQGLADISPQLQIWSGFLLAGARWAYRLDLDWASTAPEGLLRPPRM